MGNTVTRTIYIALIVALIGTSIWYLERKQASSTHTASPDTVTITDLAKPSEKAMKYEPAKEIVNPSGFINTGDKPITIKQFIGKKVILVDFWTYSCINCQRTLPYLTKWYDKYKDQGLEIVSIHTPEFEFEKDYNNVLAATKKFGVAYPVVLDNDYGTWSAYKNRYWPRKYLIDIDGYIVYDHIGEGGYQETEELIQKLLAERAQRLGIEHSDMPTISTAEDVGARQIGDVRSPETYFGSSRNQYFGSGVPGQAGEGTFKVPADLNPNTLYLGGSWNVTSEYAVNTKGDARIVFLYYAKNINFVASAKTPIEVEVLLDGKPVDKAIAGSDIMFKGGKTYTTIQKAGLYDLVNDPNGSGAHTIEIRVPEAGLEAFTFTFG